MNLNVQKNIRDNRLLRDSFNELAKITFGLSFEAWYRGGYWTDKYIPYAVADGGKIVANVSVNIIDTIWDNLPKRYIQLGTVMTDTAYRGKGLCRGIMEEILSCWQDSCDAVYLYANDTVLDFYPKFGFVRESEYQYTAPVVPCEGNVIKLDMSVNYDRELLCKYYAKSNPFSVLPMLDNYGLLMFYCSAFMKDWVFYCGDFDAVVVAMQDDDTLVCCDVYCDDGKSLPDILAAVAGSEARRVVLGFTPGDAAGYAVNAVDDDDSTLFVLKSKENVFTQNKVMMPSLSHA